MFSDDIESKLNSMGIAKRKRVISFLNKCEKSNIDPNQFNVDLLGKTGIETLSKILFGESKKISKHYSSGDKSIETKVRNVMKLVIKDLHGKGHSWDAIKKYIDSSLVDEVRSEFIQSFKKGKINAVQ